MLYLKRLKRGRDDMGRNIKILRKQKKLSVQNLALLTGLSKTRLTEIENDQHEARPDELLKIAGALGVEVKELRYRESKYRI